MYARKRVYGIIMIGAMLLAGCSHDDVTVSVTPETLVPILFDCALDNSALSDGATNNDYPTTRAIIGHSGAMNSEDLYYTGFGVFASVKADGKPNLMYNQEVTFTFVGDMSNPLKGFWSYSPIKYWPMPPNDEDPITNFSICAYAPYTDAAPVVDPDASPDDNDNTGIIGISPNTETPYVWYRRSLRPEDNVDLLWRYQTPNTVPAASGDKPKGTLGLSMLHSLARLQLRIKVNAAPAAGTKVLVKKITLSGSMAKQGKLILNSHTIYNTKIYPVWENQTNEERTIIIDSDENNADSYGIIDNEVRYIDGLPYSWQPAGVTTTQKNALFTIDRQTYVYLIPQNILELSVKVDYVKMTSESKTEDYTKTVTVGPFTPFRGNTTYNMDLILKDI